MQGQWLGQWGGEWLGAAGEGGNPVAFAGLVVAGVGLASMHAAIVAQEAPKLSAGGGSIGAPWSYIPFNPVKARRPKRVRDEELAIF